jgi:hypothetical protein
MYSFTPDRALLRRTEVGHSTLVFAEYLGDTAHHKGDGWNYSHVFPLVEFFLHPTSACKAVSCSLRSVAEVVGILGVLTFSGQFLWIYFLFKRKTGRREPTKRIDFEHRR